MLLAADLGLIDAGLAGTAATDLFPVIQTMLSGDANANPAITGVFEADLPLLGDHLATHAAGKIADTIEQVWSDPNNATQGFSFSTADVQGARAEIAARFASLGATIATVSTTGSVASDLVVFEVPLNETLANQTFDLSLVESPSVEVLLGHVGQLAATVTWTLNLVVGVTDTSFFIDVADSSTITNGADELTVNVTGSINSNLTGYGKLGIFGSLYKQDASTASTFNHTYKVDLTTANTNKRLTSAQWSTDLDVDQRITGTAVAHLDADFSAVPDFGGLVTGVDAAIDMDYTTDVKLEWKNFTITNPSTDMASVELTYSNTQVNLLKFFTEFISPTTGQVRDIVQPFSTIIDIFKNPIPGINDLFQKLKLGQGPSLIDLITLGATLAGNQKLVSNLLILDTLFLEPVDALLDLPTFTPGDFTQSAQSGGGAMVPIGSTKYGFVTSYGPGRSDATGRKFQRLNADHGNEVLRRTIDGLKNPGGKKVKAERLFYGGAGFAFPFLDDPGLLFDMMVGSSDVEFASFTTTLGLDFKFEIPFGFPFTTIKNILSKVGVSVGFGLEIVFSIATNFKYGYDAAGIKLLTDQLDFTNTTFLALSVSDNIDALKNGHFLDDHNTTGTSDGVPTAGLLPAAFTGNLDGTLSTDFVRSDRDNPELVFKLSVKPFANIGFDLDILSLSAKLSAGLVGSLIFDLNDLPNGTVEFLLSDGSSVPRPMPPYSYDGKVRGLELEAIADYAPNLTVGEAISTAGGFLNVGGSLVFEGGFSFNAVAFRFLKASYSLQFVKVTLASGQFPNDDSRLVNSIVNSPPVLASVAANGTLNVFAGSTASSRQFTTSNNAATSDNSTFEEFTFASLGPTDAQNPSAGETIVVSFVGRDSINGTVVGSGQQRFQNVKSISASGGSAADDFYFDSTVGVPVNVSGGAGDDMLIHNGTGAAVLNGNDDDDIIVGGTAADTLNGGNGADMISGAAGGDMLNGGAGNDTLEGGPGNDTVNGDANDDNILWEVTEGNDTVSGGSGTDELVASGATMTIVGVALASPSSPTIVELMDDITVTKNGASLSITAAGGGAVGTTTVEAVSLQLGDGGDTVTVDRVDAAGGDHTLNIEMIGGTTTFSGLETNASAERDDVVMVRAVSDNDMGSGIGAVVEIDANTNSAGSEKLMTRLINTDKTIDSLVINTGGGSSGDAVTVEHGTRVPTGFVALAINAGAGNDTIVVENGDVTIDAGAGTNAVTVGYGNHSITSTGTTNVTVKDFGRGTSVPVITSSQSSSGTVRIVQDSVTDQVDIDVPAGNLLIDTSLSTVGSNATILSTFSDATTMTGGALADTFTVRTAAAPVTLNGGGGNDVLTVETTTAAIAINGNGGDDTAVIGAGVLSGIGAAVTVSGDAGADTIVYDASSDQTARTSINVGNTSVANIGTPTDPTFNSTVETVKLDLGVAANTVTDSSIDRHLSVDGGTDVTGTETVNVTMIGASTGGSDGRKLTTVNVESVNFTHDNQGSSATHTWLLQGSQLLASPTSTRSGIQHVTLDAAGVTLTTLNLGDTTGSDNLIVRSLTEPTVANLRGGDDTVTLGDSLSGSELTIDAVQAPLSLNGGGDSGDLIQFDEAGRTAAGTINLTGTTIASSAGSTITYSGVPSLNLTGRDDPAATYTLNVDDTAAIVTAINLPGAGEDLVTVSGDNSALDITAGATDLLVFDLSAETAGVTATLQDEPTDVTGNVLNYVHGTTDVTFSGFGLAQVIGSPFGETLTINTDVAIPLLIEGNDGIDLFNITQIGARTDVIGGADDDTVDVSVPGSPGAAVHSNLYDDLRVWAELLKIDNSASTTATKWQVDTGNVRYDNDGNGNDDFLPFVRSTGADEVKIIAGSTPTTDTLVIEEPIGAVSAVIDAGSVTATDGQQAILAPAMGAPDLVSDFDIRAMERDLGLFYGIDGSGTLSVFNAGTLALIDSISGFGMTAATKLDAYSNNGFNRAVAVTTTTGFAVFEINGSGFIGATPAQTATTSAVVDVSWVLQSTRILWVAEAGQLEYFRDGVSQGTVALPGAGSGNQIKGIEVSQSGFFNVYVAIDVPGADNDVLGASFAPGFIFGPSPFFSSSLRIGEGEVSFAGTGSKLFIASQADNRLDIVDTFGTNNPPQPGFTHQATLVDGSVGVTGLAAPTAVSANSTHLFVASGVKDTLAVYETDGQFRQLLLDKAVTSIGGVTGLGASSTDLVIGGAEGVELLSINGSPASLTHGVSFTQVEGVTVNTGGGADTILQTAAPAAGAFALDTGGGADNLALSHFGPGYTVDTGTGNDTIGVSGTLGGTLDINSGANSDTINVSGAVSASTDVNIDIDGTSNNVTLSGFSGSGGTFDIDATGSSSDDIRVALDISSTAATINTSTGNDLLEVLALGAGSTVTADLGAGVDHAFIDLPALDDTVTVNVDAGASAGDTLDPGAIGSVNLPNNTDGFEHSINNPSDPQGTATVSGVGTLIYDGFEDIPGFVPTRATASSFTIREGDGSIQFNATVFAGSKVSNTTIVSVDWDLDGDGLFDDATGEDPLFTFGVGTNGWDQILTVTRDGVVPIDDDGMYAIAVKAVDSIGDVAIGHAVLTVTDSTASVGFPAEVFEAFAGERVDMPVQVLDAGDDPVSQITVTYPDQTTQTLTPLAPPGNVAEQIQTFTFSHTFIATQAFVELDVDYVTDEATFMSSVFIGVLPPAPTIGADTVTISEGDSLTFTPATIGADSVLIEFSGDDLRTTGTADFTATPNQAFTITWTHLNAVGVNDDGTYTFELFADATTEFGVIGPRPFDSDPDPDSSKTTITLIVDNADPTGTLTGDSVSESQDATVSFASVSDPAPSDNTGTFTLTLDIGNDGTVDQTDTITGAGSKAFTIPAAQLNNGALSVPVLGTITDKDGGATQLFTQIAVSDVVPTLTLTGGAAVNEGSAYSLTLAATGLDLGGATAQWLIEWGDNTTSVFDGASGTIDHTYADNDADGMATITATLADRDGTYDAQKTIAVNDVAPTLGFSTDTSTADEGTLLAFDLSVTDPGNDLLQSWLIDWGDGSAPQLFGGGATQVVHDFVDDGTFNITATATDEEGTHTATPLNLTINNVAPDVEFTAEQGNQPILIEGGDLNLTIGDIPDVGRDFASQITINWGDGDSTTLSVPVDAVTAESEPNDDGVAGAMQTDLDVANDLRGSFTLDNTYSGAGQRYGASITGSIGSGDDEDFLRVDVRAGDTLNIDVSGALSAPVIQLLTPSATNTPTLLASEPSTGSLSFGNFTEDLTAYVVVTSAGSATGTYTLDVDHVRLSSLRFDPLAATHRYDDGPATRTISVQVVDEDGTHTASTTLDVTVLEIPPTIAVSGPAAVDTGQTYTLDLGTVVDLGDDTATGFHVEWGDGNSETIAVAAQATHQYGSAGTFTVVVSVIDEDGTSRPGAGAYQLNLELTDADAPDVLTAETEPNDDGTDGISAADVALSESLDPNFVPVGGRDFQAVFSGQIESLTDFGDFFEISALNGESITVTLNGFDGGFGTLEDPKLALVDSSGAVLASNDDIDVDDRDAELTFAFTTTGQYFIAVDTELIPDPNDNTMTIRGVGTYKLTATLNRPTAADLLTAESGANDDGVAGASAADLPFANDLTGSFVPGAAGVSTATITGTISEGLDRDLDFFRIAAAPGDTLTIDLVSDQVSGALRDPVVRLFDVNGVELASDDDSGGVNNARLTFSNFTYDGDYFVVADSNETFGVTVVTVTAVTDPRISVSGDANVLESATYTLSLGAITGPGAGPGAGLVDQIIVDWGDGTTDNFTSTGDVTHVYVDDFRHTISVDLEITNTSLFEDAAALVVDVQSAPPTVDAVTLTMTIDEDGVANISGSFSDAGTLDTHAVSIDWMDGATTTATVDQNAGTFADVHQYLDDPAGTPDTFSVQVTVTDDDGASGADAATVTVNNVTPSLNAGIDRTVDEGELVSLDPALFNDLGTQDTHTATIDWGDGSSADSGIVDYVPPGGIGVEGTVGGSHVYADNGLYTVTVTLTDDDGGSTSDSLTVTVNNVAPTLDPVPDVTGFVHRSVMLAPTLFNDLGTLDTHSATIDWDDGGPQETIGVGETPFGPPGSTAGMDGTFLASHTYTAGGTYSVSITLTDDDGGSTTDTVVVTIEDKVVVTGVEVSGSDWNISRHQIPDGSAAQLTPLHWGNVDEIYIHFNDGITFTPGAIQVSGVLGPDGVLDANVDYSFVTSAQAVIGRFTLVLTFPRPLGVDKLLIKLDGTSASAITSTASGLALDGEWTNASDTFPSGDGNAGGDFQFRINSLPGDADGDGSVGDTDLAIMLTDFGKAFPTPLLNGRSDMTGSQSVGDPDLSILLTNFGGGLPGGTPTAPSTSGSPIAIAPLAAMSAAPEWDLASDSQVDLIAAADSGQAVTAESDAAGTSRAVPRRAGRMRAWIAAAGLKMWRQDRPLSESLADQTSRGLLVTKGSTNLTRERIGEDRNTWTWMDRLRDANSATPRGVGG